MSKEKLEAAARKLCELRGIDPDECDPYDGHNSLQYGVPYWRRVLPEIEAFLQIQQAIELS